MRLWHEALIPYLPRQQLLGQHRECCALRGLGWGRKHATVNYVFEHHPAHLVAYHILVMEEMDNGGEEKSHACHNNRECYLSFRCFEAGVPQKLLMADGFTGGS